MTSRVDYYVRKGSSSFVINVREAWWKYPESLIGLAKAVVYAYSKAKPLSVILFVGFLVGGFFCFLYLNFPQIQKFLYKSNTKTFIEGVVSSPLLVVNPLPTSSVPKPYTQLERDIEALIFDPLIRVKSDGSIEPRAASSVVMLEDAKVVSLSLRRNVKWHDGKPMTVDDVLFTFDLVKRMGGSGVYFSSVDGVSIVKVDDYTLSLTLEKPNPAYLETLVWPVLPKHLLEGIDDPTKIKESYFSSHPVGTGIYSVVSFSSSEIILEKNEMYWGEKPEIDKIIFRLYETMEAALTALKAGVVHAVCDYDLGLTNIDSKVAVAYPALLIKRNMVLYFNLREGKAPFLKDEKVRQALAYATPKSAIVKDILKEYAEEAYGPIPQWSWAFYGGINRYDYNLGKANELLDAAGYKFIEGNEYRTKGDQIAEITITFQDDKLRAAIASAIAASWKQIGVRVNLRPIPYYLVIKDQKFENALYQMVVPSRDFEALLFMQEAPIDPDRYSLYYSTNSDYPGGNLSGYKDTKIDVDLELGRSTLDKTARKENYDRIQRRIMNDVPLIFLFTPKIVYFVSPRVEGVDLSGLITPENRFVSISKWRIK